MVRPVWKIAVTKGKNGRKNKCKTQNSSEPSTYAYNT